MDRLICGDVGYGKTEIAVRAAFKAVMDGKQVAVLVPTTLLAEQHHVTFSERFAPFPVKVAMLSRFLSPPEQAEVVDKVAKGEVDVVIGTHRLLSADMRFKDLGLLVVDEEQRFGVSHKERLKRLRTSVDVLTMTATPIPRTLEMALGGDPRHGERGHAARGSPAGADLRRPVRRGHGAGRRAPRAAARRAGVLGPQPRARRSGAPPGSCRRSSPTRAIVDRARPDGRGPAREGDDGVLGPRRPTSWSARRSSRAAWTCRAANTLVVERADRLGLAQMYQLRGRVGRSAERAFAYFFFPPQASADRGGARAAGGDQPVHRPGVGVPDRDAGPGDPRRGEPAGRRAARPHRGGRVRHVRAAAGRGGRGDEGRAGRGGARGARSTCRCARSSRRGGWDRSRSGSSCTGGSRWRATTTSWRGCGRRPRTGSARIPDEVRTLFAHPVAAPGGLATGVEEISTIRMQIRVKPVAPERGACSGAGAGGRRVP